MQVLHKMKELKEGIKDHKKGNQEVPEEQLVNVTGDLFNKLDNQGESFEPWGFLNKMFQVFPQLAEKEPDGRAFRQQDADEYF